MATQPRDHQRENAENEYRVWAQICYDKHGLPWPITEDELPDAALPVLVQEIKRLKVLARTPHEG